MSHSNFKIALELLASFLERNLDSRVAHRLLVETDDRGDAAGWVALSQPELGDTLAVSLPTMQRCLRRLISKNLIKVGYSKT